jgi:hypothetical protein
MVRCPFQSVLPPGGSLFVNDIPLIGAFIKEKGRVNAGHFFQVHRVAPGAGRIGGRNDEIAARSMSVQTM